MSDMNGSTRRLLVWSVLSGTTAVGVYVLVLVGYLISRGYLEFPTYSHMRYRIVESLPVNLFLFEVFATVPWTARAFGRRREARAVIVCILAALSCLLSWGLICSVLELGPRSYTSDPYLPVRIGGVLALYLIVWQIFVRIAKRLGFNKDRQ